VVQVPVSQLDPRNPQRSMPRGEADMPRGEAEDMPRGEVDEASGPKRSVPRGEADEASGRKRSVPRGEEDGDEADEPHGAEGAPTLVATLQPGDALHIPAAWFHYVESGTRADAISVAVSMVTRSTRANFVEVPCP
jgi:hypothetical protein